ncbi:MAG: ATP-binding protein [Planctomycetaceae bacterium]|nr:ATP-binding protein [Planctomycetaceae bacterium]
MITADEFDQLFDVIIPSDTIRGQEVQERIISHMEQFQFSDRDIFSMRLALEEGIINAIKHGNRLDLDKSVRIAWGISPEKIRVVILDEGPGFKPELIPDPTADENLERPCGRGIMLMKAFLDLMQYNERGNQLTIEKKNTSS